MDNLEQQYKKVERFVTAEWTQLLDKNRVLVKNHKTGYMVGKYLISQCEAGWQVVSPNTRTVIGTYRYKRSAILAAALIIRKKYTDAGSVQGLDQKYDMYQHDFQVFSIRCRINPDNLTYQHRLHSVENQLDMLKNNLHELEKKADLQ